MYKIIKTNKKSVVYHFDTLEALDVYSTKNRYGQGNVELYHNGTKINDVSNLYNLNSYCLNLILANYDLKRKQSVSL